MEVVTSQCHNRRTEKKLLSIMTILGYFWNLAQNDTYVLVKNDFLFPNKPKGIKRHTVYKSKNFCLAFFGIQRYLDVTQDHIYMWLVICFLWDRRRIQDSYLRTLDCMSLTLTARKSLYVIPVILSCYIKVSNGCLFKTLIFFLQNHYIESKTCE